MTWAMAGIGLAVLLAACSAFFIRRRKRESNRRWSWADNWSVWDREKLKKVLQEEEPDKGAAKFWRFCLPWTKKRPIGGGRLCRNWAGKLFYYFFDGLPKRKG